MKKSTSLTLALLLCMAILTSCSSLKNEKIAKQNKETVRLWFEEGWNNERNEELLERCFTPDWSDGNPLMPGQVAGYKGMLELINSYKAGATETHFTITHLFANKSQVVIRYEVDALHSGFLFGISATGKRFTSTGIVLYEMVDGRIATSWQELDLTSILNQLKD
jgi:predicted ester cyclase